MAWADDPIYVIDTETTGVDPETARVWELGLVVGTVAGGVRESASFRINPGCPVPKEIVNLCRLSAADLDEIGASPSWETARTWFVPDAIVAAYNGFHYDFPLIQAENRRIGRPDPFAGARLLDPLVLLREMFPDWQSCRLAVATKRLVQGIDVSGAHGALADCLMTFKIIQALVPDLPDDWSDLESYQTAARSAQEADRAEFGGWLRRIDGRLRLGQGKYCGMILDRVDPGYLIWILKNESSWDKPLTAATRTAFREALGIM